MLDYNKLSTRDKFIQNLFGGIGIIAGLLARRAVGVSGMLPGALFGVGGAICGAMVGRVVIALLPPSDKVE